MNKHTEPEVWKPVVGYEGIYEVSSHGRARSLPRYDAAGSWRNGRVLKQSNTPKGYKIVTLTKNGKQKVASVHVLVAETFLGPKPDGLICCHYDDDPANNAITNLRWDTYVANAADRRRNRGTYLPNGVSLRDHKKATHCRRGHPFDELNTYVSPAGQRACRRCKADAVLAHYRKNRERILQERTVWRNENREEYRRQAREWRRKRQAA